MLEDVRGVVSLTEIEELAVFVEKNFGYDFSEYTLTSFKRRLERLLELFQFSSVADLITRLEKEPAFIRDFIEEITVNASEIFRNPGFWLSLKEEYLPQLLKEKEKITIWIAASAAGEEVYSLAILLKENGWHDRVSVLATDLDDVIFSKAFADGYQCRQLEKEYSRNYEKSGGQLSLNKYYDQNGAYAVMNKDLLSNTKFLKHDLVKDLCPGQFDMVFCRNVMIYFNGSLQNRVYQLLHESININGYLAIGAKESMVWSDIARKFELANKEEKIFRKIAL